jgi:hypothetical protein
MSDDHQDASPLTEIVAEFEKTTPIERDKVKRWMETEDIEATGALMSLLADKKHFQRIDPPLAFQEYFPFATHYYERSIGENPDGEWSDSRTTAGWDFAKWFIHLWENRPTYDSETSDLKSLLRRLYEGGSQELRSALVTSVLEHLFQRPDIADYFTDWENEPLLNPAYAEAKELANLHRRLRERDASLTD